MRRASNASICVRALRETGRAYAEALGAAGRRSTCQISAAASSRALSVPCPKWSLARASRRALRASTAATQGVAAEPRCRAGSPRHNRRRNRRTVLVLLSLGAAAVVAGALLAHLLSGSVPLQTGTWLPHPRTPAEFHLHDL